MHLFHTANPIVNGAGVVGTTIGGAGMVLAQDIATDGIDASTGITLAVFSAGSTALGLMWKAMRADQAVAAEMRRAEDERRQGEFDRLAAENNELRERIDELTDLIINGQPGDKSSHPQT